MSRDSIGSQIHKNIVAIISMILAIAALSYNTWRNEKTERNRNIRPAAFEVLKELGQLQIIVNDAHYETNSPGSMNPMLGWGHVSLISDLGQILPPPMPFSVNKLVHVWGDNWQQIRTNEASVDAITKEIDASREIILTQLKSLK